MLSNNYSQKLLDHTKQSLNEALKISSKREIQKAEEGTSHLIGNECAIKLWRFQKIHNKIIQRHLKTRMIKKYLKKDMYHQKKGRKLLMI